MIIGITGYAGSGKDTLARSLKLRYGFRRVAFADKLKELAYDLNPLMTVEVDLKGTRLPVPLQHLVDVNGWDRVKQEDTVRRFLQTLGQSARERLGEDVWVQAANAQVWAYIQEGKHVAITDVRYPNEAEYVRSLGGKVWRIVRPDTGPINEHVTETNTATLPVDELIMNDGTQSDLGRKVTELLNKYGV